METEIIFIGVGVFALLLASAFFSGSETALMSVSKPKLHNLEERDNHKGATRVNKLLEKPETLLSTILLGNNLVNIGASALTTGLFIKLFGEAGVAMATIIMTILVLIFAEVLPKTLANRHAETIAFTISPVMTFLVFALKPFTYTIRMCNKLTLRLFGVKGANTSSFSEEDVKGAIGMGLAEGVLEQGEHRMLDSILELDEITVEDVMTHRSSMNTLSIDLNTQELFDKIVTSTHSRLPMWEGEQDNIIGILHIKDFFSAYAKSKQTGEDIDVKSILKQAYFVPESAPISKQLLEFRNRKAHLALVVDEYGSIEGLVSLEDILEEIVGDIEDEHDREEDEFAHNKDGSITADGHLTVRDANREFGWNLDEELAVTLAGLIIEHADRIPVVGESIEIDDLIFTIKAKKRQAITKVHIERKD